MTPGDPPSAPPNGPPSAPPSGARCGWAEGSPEMRRYHDQEWGVPSHDDRHLFELLLLEGAQAGLSWSTVLARREGYRKAFDDFDPRRVAAYDADRLSALLADPGIVRNRLKVASTVTNARAFLAVQGEHGTFADYLWGWVDGMPVVNHPTDQTEVPPHSGLSDRLSKDLKRRGFTFVGSTIVYAFLQAAGVVDDHLVGCPAKRPYPRPAPGDRTRVRRAAGTRSGSLRTG